MCAKEKKKKEKKDLAKDLLQKKMVKLYFCTHSSRTFSMIDEGS